MEEEIYELIYKIDKKNKYLRILGEKFYIRNKLSGYFIFKNKKYPLKDKIIIKNIKENEIKIYLIFIKVVLDKSYMFSDSNLVKILKKRIRRKEKTGIEAFQFHSYEKKILSNYFNFSEFYDSFDDLEINDEIKEIKKIQLI